MSVAFSLLVRFLIGRAKSFAILLSPNRRRLTDVSKERIAFWTVTFVAMIGLSEGLIPSDKIRALVAGFFTDLAFPTIGTLFWKRMAIQAMSFAGVLSSCAVASKSVVTRWHKSYVNWIAAPRVVTHEMIQLWNVLSKPARDWFYKPRIQHSVRLFFLTCKFYPAVRPAWFFLPIPAACLRIDSDVLEDPSELRSVHVRNGEILRISHGAASCAGSGLEPFGAFTRSGGSLYFNAERPI